MGSNTSSQATVNLQILDNLTPGSNPVTWNRNIGPIIFQATGNEVMQYAQIPHTGFVITTYTPIPPGSLLGLIYIRNNSTQQVLTMQTNLVGGATTSMPINPGGFFLYANPGTTGSVGWTFGGASGNLNTINLIAPSGQTIPVEYMISY